MAHYVARFHERHGPNVVVANGTTEATWQLTRSGGVLFSQDPLGPGDNVKVTCDGSGRVRMGCTTTDPRLYQTSTADPQQFLTSTTDQRQYQSLSSDQRQFQTSVPVPDSVDEISGFEVMNEIRFHKRDCSVYMHLNSSGETITSSCGFLKYDKVIHRKQRVWLAVYIMFGDVTITATRHDTQMLSLSPSHGINVRLYNDRTVATSVHQSPGAFCVTSAPLRLGDTIFIKCQPTVDKGQAASNFYLKLLISNLSPAIIPNSRSNFSLTDICAAKPPFTVVETLRKAECDGEVRVSVLKHNRLEYSTATNKINSQTLWFDPSTEGAWLYLELYRVRIAIASHRSDIERQRSNPYDYARSELPVSFQQRQRTLSARSASPTSICSSQYTHVTCGSRARTLPFSPQLGNDVTDYAGAYADARPLHLSTSCPADLNQDATDEVDGLCHSLNDLTSQFKTLHRNVEALTTVVAGRTCLIPDSDNGEALSVSGIRPVGGALSESSDIRPIGGALSENSDELSNLRLRMRQNWRELVNCLQTEDMADLLFQHDVISLAEMDKIRCRLKADGQSEANRHILDILFRRGVERSLLEKILDKAGDCHIKTLFFKP